MLDLPLEYALIQFKGDKFSGEIVPALLDLAQREVVRFVDLVFILKEEDRTHQDRPVALVMDQTHQDPLVEGVGGLIHRDLPVD